MVDRIDRRDALTMLMATALSSACTAHSYATAAAARKPSFLTSDVGKLRRVIMCPPPATPLGKLSGSDELMHMPDYDIDAAVGEYAELTRLVRASGAEILFVPDLLGAAIDQARSRGVWETWLRATHPKLMPMAASVTAQTLLGRDPRTQFQLWPDGTYRHVLDPVYAFIWMRDVAAMLPSGIVFMNTSSRARQRESVLTRFMFEFAPQLARYPVLLDAREEGLLAEGGDFQVVDEHTLFLGIGNRTDPRLAPLLARRLQVDVLAIQTRKADWLRAMGKPFELRTVFLHLDTYFTHLADKKALALPWFLEAAYAGKDPYTHFLQGMAADSAISDDDLNAGREFMKEFGWVRMFRAGSGEEDTSVKDMKLVDYVRSRGYEVHFVGGEPVTDNPIAHLFDVGLYEHERQGANVIATSPGNVIAYEGASRTHSSLRQAGIAVATFPGRELWPWDGGPHCLTLPLERG